MRILGVNWTKLFLVASVLVLGLVIIGTLQAQEEFLNPTTDIDDIFGSLEEDSLDTDESDDTNSHTTIDDNGGDDGIEILDIVRGSSVRLSGNFAFNIGYSAGWTNVPWVTGGGGDGGFIEGFQHGALTDSKSHFGLDFRIAPIFRVYLSFKLDFPTFQAEVAELFVDYNLLDVVFFRIGRQELSWGISRFHPHTNLMARLPDDWITMVPPLYDTKRNVLKDADSYTIKMAIPAGASTIEFVGFTRTGFMDDIYSPEVSDIGVGGLWNLAVPLLDLTLGSYFHAEQQWRSYLSVGTSIFKVLEIYSEGLVAYDLAGTVRFGVNAGFLVGFFNHQLQWSGEYYYTTEDKDMWIKNSSYPLIAGHNIATGLSFFTKDSKFRSYAQVMYNVNEKSGLFVPTLSGDPWPFLTLSAAVPVIFGSSEGTYFQQNPSENLDRPVSFVFTIKLSGSF